MKVFIENSDKNIDLLKGKSLFCGRLADALRLEGIEVTGNLDSKADISLNIIRIKHFKSAKKILRLDNVWHDTGKPWRRKNKSIKEAVKQADGIVYQSEFARRMCDTFLGEPSCPSTVIFNGSDPSYYKNVIPIEENFRYVILAFSKWRPHKRLRDIIKSFLLADIEDSLLVISGDMNRSDLTNSEITEYFNLPNIRWTGMITQNILASYLKIAKASIHLCWFDACPNSVVEAIVAGVPVITNNVGGTWEIVGPSGGYVLTLDKPYDYEPVDLYHPPKVNLGIIAEAIRDCIKKQPKITCDHVHIRNVAKQYYDFMERVFYG